LASREGLYSRVGKKLACYTTDRNLRQRTLAFNESRSVWYNGAQQSRAIQLFFSERSIMPDRPISPQSRPEEVVVDAALRPHTLAEMVGQDRLRENLEILIQAARARGEALDHVLLYGPPGLGKTTLAHILSNEMGVGLKVTAGPAIERAGDLAAILTNLRQGDILFIDEVHRLGRAVEEVLYPAMEDFALDIVIGKGPSARNIRLKLPRFTLIGATTRLALMTAPLRARFGAVYRFDFYEVEAVEKIVRRAAGLLQAPITSDGVAEIARRGRGTPRVALRLLRRVRDYAQVRSDGIITGQMAQEALALLDVDELGLDALDRAVLGRIIRDFRGGPVGLETIAASLSEEPDTIMDVVEPYLLQLGFLDRTARGRMATRKAYAHLGEPFPETGEQPALFEQNGN
jgi:Holliday junction DNA helicase RuvB